MSTIAIKKKGLAYRGEQIFTDVASDGTDTTVYSEPFAVANGSVWAIQFGFDDDSTTYAGTVTLQASCRPSPEDGGDTGWVAMTDTHGWDGWPQFPHDTGGACTITASGDQEDLIDVGFSGALWYRLKVARSAGSSVLNAWVSVKDAK